MKNLLKDLSEYLADRLELTLGKQVFYNELPDAPDEAVLVQERKTINPTVPQIDAVSRRVVFTTRAKSNEASYDLACRVYRWMWYSSTDEDEVPTGFLELLDGSFVFSDIRGTPIWDKSDQKGRKYFTFEAVVTTQKL